MIAMVVIVVAVVMSGKCGGGGIMEEYDVCQSLSS